VDWALWQGRTMGMARRAVNFYSWEDCYTVSWKRKRENDSAKIYTCRVFGREV
jgi:hypothetical protein